MADYNENNKADIKAGLLPEKKESSADFIYNASGIKRRYVRDKAGVLNPKIMWPNIPERKDSELSIQAEEGVKAAINAMNEAEVHSSDIDAVIVASSHKQRDYPTVSIEIQNALGVDGFAFDLGNACSSGIFGIQVAYSLLLTKDINTILVISPEIKSGQFDLTDRDSHFIFGEATTAIVIEKD